MQSKVVPKDEQKNKQSQKKVTRTLPRVSTKLPARLRAIPKALWQRYKALSRKKKIALIVVLLVLAFIANSQYQKANQPPKYELEAARLDSVVELVSETGNVTTAGSTPIYSTTTGIVEEVFVENGQTVTKGTKLFKVVSTATQQEKDAALAAYLTAKTALETARSAQYSAQATMFSKWDTFKELAESDDYEEEDGTPKNDQRGLAEFHIPEKEWLAAENEYKKQAVAVNQAQANLSAAWQAYQATQDSEITAILDGEIRNLALAKGDTVSVPTATTLSASTPALVLFTTDVPIVVKIDVGETDAVKVKEGQPVVVQLDAVPNQNFSGMVDRVDTIAAPTDGVVKYATYIRLDPASQQEHDAAQALNTIRGGMTADVDITVASKEKVLTVPASAVKPYEGGRAVRVPDENDEIEYLPVMVGARGDGRVEILSGIEEGTEVIVALKNEQVDRSGSGGFF